MKILVILRKNNVRCLFHHKECIFSRPLLWNRFSIKASFRIKVPFHFLQFCSLPHSYTLHRKDSLSIWNPSSRTTFSLSYHKSSLMTLLLSKTVCFFDILLVDFQLVDIQLFLLWFFIDCFLICFLFFLSSHCVVIVLNYNIEQRRVLYKLDSNDSQNATAFPRSCKNVVANMLKDFMLKDFLVKAGSDNLGTSLHDLQKGWLNSSNLKI